MEHTNKFRLHVCICLKWLKDYGVTVYRYFTLVGCEYSSDQQAGREHLTVVGRNDRTGPRADRFHYTGHDKRGFSMAGLLKLKYKRSIFHNLKMEY